MATEKTINTRIQLKYSSLEEWSDLSVAGKGGNLVLKAGEVGICAVPSGSSLKQTTPPAIMFKVGDGTTAFKDLPWASGLAADVYPWAKAPTPPTGDGTITIKQAGVTNGTFTVNQTGNTTIELTDNNTQYKLELEDHILTLKSKEIGETAWNTVVSTITLPDNDTTYAFAEGDLDGTFTVTPKDGSAQRVKIKNVATTSGAVFTGPVAVLTPTADMNPATKQYVDSAIGKINSFEYVVVKGTLPTASKDTMYKIYLVADSTNKESQDNYDEYITVLTDTSTYTWEKIGNTTLDLSGYITLDGEQIITGHKTFQGSTAQFRTLSDGLNDPKTTVDAEGVLCQTAGNAGTYYKDGKIVSGTTSTILTLPSTKSGTFALTSDIPGIMIGATSSKDGSKGLVPAPLVGEKSKFLRGDGSWAVPIDSKVTSAENHYTPTADSASQLTANAAGGSSATWNTTQLVTGVNIQRDAKGHITGLTVDSIKMPANPDTNTAHAHTNGVGLVKTGNGGPTGNVEYKVALASETLDTNAAVSRPAANANRTYPVIADKNGKLATIVPWTDTDTNTHYTSKNVIADSESGNADSGNTLENGSVYLNHVENGSVTSHHPIIGTGATKVKYAMPGGQIVIDSTDTGVTDVEITGSGNAVTSATISGRKLKLTKDTTFITDISGKQDKITSTNKLSASLVSGLATVATSGSYNDLSNKPDIASLTNPGLMSPTDRVKLNGIDDGAQVNKIESITVGGTAKTISNKTVALGAAADKEVDDSITANSTSTKLPTSKAVEERINAHAGIDKVGTVTSVGISTTTNGGLKVTNSPVTSSGTINIDIDDSIVFVLNCGSATVNV